MAADIESLLESLELACCRCGRRGPDTFTDLPGLEQFLAAPRIPMLTAARIEPGIGIRTISADDVARFGPVHASCLRPARPQRPAAERPPYNLERSVA